MTSSILTIIINGSNYFSFIHNNFIRCTISNCITLKMLHVIHSQVALNTCQVNRTTMYTMKHQCVHVINKKNKKKWIKSFIIPHATTYIYTYHNKFCFFENNIKLIWNYLLLYKWMPFILFIINQNYFSTVFTNLKNNKN